MGKGQMDTLDRMAAASWAAALVKRADVLYLDTETTGLGNDAEIVDIAVIDSSGRIILNALVRPSGRIPREASDVLGSMIGWLRMRGPRRRSIRSSLCSCRLVLPS